MKGNDLTEKKLFLEPLQIGLSMYLAAYMCNIFGSQVHWTLKNSDTQENTLQILIWRACMCIYSPISGWYFSVTCVYLYVVEMKTEKGSRNGILENGENVMCMSEADMYLIFCVFWMNIWIKLTMLNTHVVLLILWMTA